VNAHELNQRLCDSIDQVLAHLFPQGKKVGAEFVIGNLDGSPGDSLKIHCGGAKKGQWCDFAANKKSRTLLGLWAEVLGGNYAQACKEARSWLGIADDYSARFTRTMPVKKAAEKVDYSKVRNMLDDGVVERYLVNERRLDPVILDLYSVGQSADGNAVAFPFMETQSRDGEVSLGKSAYMVKFIKVAREDGKKMIWTQPSGVTDSLFGKKLKFAVGHWPKGVIVITEGEIDALSVASFGYHGVSVPRGAKSATGDGKSANDPWIEADFEWLANFERIYLWLDSDEAGQKAARDIAQRIGLERCFLVQTPAPYKDANECLMAGLRPQDVALAFEKAVTLDPANLVWAGEFEDKVLRRLFPPGGVEPGFEMPWPFPWKIRPGEMTVWTGFSGHGKTVCLSQVMVHLASEGQRVCVASMEVEPDKTLETFWCQANGGRFPWNWNEVCDLSEESKVDLGTRRFRERFKWLAERVLVFLPQDTPDGVGRAKWQKLVECFVYARQRYGCEQFVVDSLMMCVGRSEQEYQQVELFVNALSSFAKRHQVHVHLVAHSRKKDDEGKPPGKQDIAGPKETADIAHNVAVVHRNMAKAKKWQLLERELKDLDGMVCASPEKEDERRAGINEKTKQLTVVKAWHDGELHLLKQRNGDGELASKYLYYNANARQFVQESPWALTRQPDSWPVAYMNIGGASADGDLPTNAELQKPKPHLTI